MPPKAAKSKADKKKIAKSIEDKTFGLKNKSKSKAVQKYVSSVVQNVRHTSGAVSTHDSNRTHVTQSTLVFFTHC
jgi:hypothetical protein